MLRKFGLNRSMHTTCLWMATNKIRLAKLRKKTGYTFANCKKALQMSENDVSKAEKWLDEQAQALGWDKARRLSGRQTLQGLVAVTCDSKNAAMVEVNCETDFIARNPTFQNLASVVANACLTVAKQQNRFENSIAKVHLDCMKLQNLAGLEGRTLADETALLISKIGENVTLRRAVCLKTTDNLEIAGYTHPTPVPTTKGNSATLYGKYGAVVVYNVMQPCLESPMNEDGQKRIPLTIPYLARQMCQHVIGMKPFKIGVLEEDLPKENKDEETTMIYQEFLMEPETLVSQLLSESGMNLIDFERFECGENRIVEEESVKSVMQKAAAA